MARCSRARKKSASKGSWSPASTRQCAMRRSTSACGPWSSTGRAHISRTSGAIPGSSSTGTVVPSGRVGGPALLGPQADAGGGGFDELLHGRPVGSRCSVVGGQLSVGGVGGGPGSRDETYRLAAVEVLSRNRGRRAKIVNLLGSKCAKGAGRRDIRHGCREEQAGAAGGPGAADAGRGGAHLCP